MTATIPAGEVIDIYAALDSLIGMQVDVTLTAVQLERLMTERRELIESKNDAIRSCWELGVNQ